MDDVAVGVDEERMEETTRALGWVIGGVVDNDERYVRRIVEFYLGVADSSGLRLER